MSKQNHGKTNKEYAEGMQNATKNEEPLLVYVMAATVCKPVHEITKNSKLWQSYCN